METMEELGSQPSQGLCHSGDHTEGKGHLPFSHIPVLIQLLKANYINLKLEKKSSVGGEKNVLLQVLGRWFWESRSPKI